jgi:two-component system, sensor histidine kinase LadS
VHLIILMLTILAGLGVFSATALTIYGALTNGLFGGALAVAFLQYRSNLNERNRNALMAELAIAERISEQERAYRMDQERLLTMLAHELKTPLSVISLALGPQKDLNLEQQATRNAVRDIRDIINQCLEADRLHHSQLKPAMEQVLLSELLSEVCDRIPELESRLRVNGETGITLRSDPRLLRIILLNLLQNAVRYGAVQMPVILDIQPDQPNGVSVTIQNTVGAAGSPDPERVFEKYYRSSGAHQRSGTGLGLYLAKVLAEKIGGTLRFSFEHPQIGFTLWIPLKNAPH